MDEWILTFRNAKPAAGQKQILIPGDPERDNEVRIKAEGISILPAVVKDLKEIAEILGVEFVSYQ